MKFTVITLFPEYFTGVLEAGLLGKAREQGLIEVDLVDLRPFGEGRHQTTDDEPYGGGAGMVMKAGPVVAAIEDVREKNPGVHVVLLTPQGKKFSQGGAERLAGLESIAFVCGRYEGFDERIRAFADEELSLGDFVLMGGEAAAAAMIEASARLVPDVLGDPESAADDSMTGGLLEYPQYTRPRDFRGEKVPEVLLGGNHGEIARWRREKAIERTAERRPDLLEAAELTTDERRLARWGKGSEDDK